MRKLERENNKKPKYVLALDVSTTTIGIALFEDNGDEKAKLTLLHHVSPKVKPKPETKMEELFKKVERILI
jgi:sugar (pentulose or hexulose) kinase